MCQIFSLLYSKPSRMKAKILKMTYRVLPDLALHYLSDLFYYRRPFASSAPATLAPCCSVNIWVMLLLHRAFPPHVPIYLKCSSYKCLHGLLLHILQVFIPSHLWARPSLVTFARIANYLSSSSQILPHLL